MDSFKAMALAEIRHAELLEQAERIRLAQRAAGSRRARTPWERVLRDELIVLHARISAMRRPDLTKQTGFAPSATETT